MLKLVKPKIDELDFRQQLLSDSKTMAFNQKYGGTIKFPLCLWSLWYQLWMYHPQYYYAYIYDCDLKKYIGEVSYYYEEEYQEYMMNIIIHYQYRGLGKGKEALKLLYTQAKMNGIRYLCDDIAYDNPMISLFKKQGFLEIWRNEEVIMLKKKL